MNKKTFIKISGYLLPTMLFFSYIFAYFMLYYRYDAFPHEKQSIKNIQKFVHGAQYKGNIDYCKPEPYATFCSENFSDSLPGCLVPSCKWGHVQYLYLNGKKMRKIPIEDIANLSNLKILNLGNNELVHLPSEIGQLQELTELDLSNNHLISLPSEINQLQNLASLNLSGNQLTSLPPEIGQLRNLTELDLSNNHLIGLPPEISQLQNLTSLNLSGNQLVSLPPEIGQLRRLTSLILGHNPLSGPLPKFLIKLPLNYLEFSETRLCAPADENFQKWIKDTSSLCSLAAKDQSAMLTLYKIPGRPKDWALQTLPCSWSGVGCDFAGHIVYLHLSSAKLTKLPSEIGQLDHLQHLDLTHGQLKELPPEIGELHNLTDLNLANNQLASLPPEIGQLRNLQTLYLSMNQITQLPREMGQLTHLKFLDVSNNPLSGSLPIFLTNIPLEHFSFENTNLCIPNDKIIISWLRRQSKGFYNAESGAYVSANPEADIKWYLEHRGCK